MNHLESAHTGIYEIRNLTNGKCYIGSAATSFKKRSKEHLRALRQGNHHSSYLQRAWIKYGESAFALSILEICKTDECIAREQWYLDNSRSEYNICRKAGSPLGIKRSPATRKKLSEMKLGNKNPMFGKYGALNHQSKRIKVYNILSKESFEFETLSNASAFLSVKLSALSGILHGKLKPYKRLQNWEVSFASSN